MQTKDLDTKQENIRNIAIIAHVDHGKTTLVDSFLKQTKVFRESQEEMSQEMILDTGDLEREKGITIKAKNIAIRYKDHKINIIDTPGHADFGGEVERTLNMAEGCILLVDAQEGPMPQTKFVLRRAIELDLKLIVVINKIDKPFAKPAETLDKVNDLILSFAVKDEQLDFPVYYAIGKLGYAFAELPTDIPNAKGDILPLLDAIVDTVPAPTGDENGAFQMQITTLHYDSHIGNYLIGKINRGKVKVGDSAVVVSDEGKTNGKIKSILVREGLDFIEVDNASTGEIVALGGIDSKEIGGTVCAPNAIEQMPQIVISNPSVQVKFEASTSPLVGEEGEYVTARLIQARLEKEIETNISLKITKAEGGGYFVAGRGELQLAILIEELRREGYEFQISKPQVVLQEVDGVLSEPREELLIEVPEEYNGAVVSELSSRKAELINMETDSNTNTTRFEYQILTRNLLGLRSNLLTLTKGNLTLNNFLLDYVPYSEQPEQFRKGVLISAADGVAMEYSLNTIQDRGELIIEPGTRVYEGMVIGVNKFEQDMEVNPTKARAKSGVRRNQAAITQMALRTIKPLDLDFALMFLGEDELLEVTPKSLRLRKKYLTKTERDWSKRDNLSAIAKSRMSK
ncbi:GTP-binding protein [Candidatus Dojkabacteria bacterium]|uniref:GTP-binding protein n=1 Tax=Candidatus Dojkabacteria bacterium TaxID=2099670 RepID=A0A955L5N5_9BACT|nr:GTP-binding protein [Candidatus Dojkabacteria bacterium]